MEDLLQVGVITSPHGVQGEVKVFPTTDDPKRFSHLREVYLDHKGYRRLLHVTNVKYFKNLVILRFEEFANKNDVETLRQCPLLVTRENAVRLRKNEYFIADLIGMRVDDKSAGLGGVIDDVYKTGANDVYDITLDDGRNLLLPVIKECVLNVDMENGLIDIHVLDGLLD